MEDKVISEISDKSGNIVSFESEIREIFQLIRDNQKQLFEDLKGSYLVNLEKEMSVKNDKES